MIYILTYLIIGMIYAGFTFKGNIKYIADHEFTLNESKLIKETETGKLSDDYQNRLAGTFFAALLLSFLTIFLYPFAIIVKLKR